MATKKIEPRPWSQVHPNLSKGLIYYGLGLMTCHYVDLTSMVSDLEKGIAIFGSTTSLALMGFIFERFWRGRRK